MKSIAPSSSSSSLWVEKTNLLYAGIPISVVVTLLSVLFISYLQKDLLGLNSLAIWFSLILLIIVIHLILMLVYRRSGIDHRNVGTWNSLFVISTAIAGIVWGSASSLMFPHHDFPHQVLLAFVVIGMTVGAVTVLAASRIATFVFILPAVLPLVSHFFLLEGEIYTSMGIMTSLFLIVLVVSTLRFNNTIKENLQLIKRTESRELELLQSKRFLEQSNKLANVGGFEITLSPKSVYWAKQTYAIHGLSEYINLDLQTIYSFFAAENAEKFSSALEKCEKENQKFDIEIPLNEVSNQYKWVRIVGQPVLDNGSVVGIIGTYLDISASKNIDKMKNEFISTVSHELRTPLTSIRGSLGLLSHGLKDQASEEQKKLLNISSNNTERLLFLINDILDIEKIESGKMEFYLLKERVKLLLKYSIEINQSYADQFDIEFVLADDIPELTIEVDAGRFAQVMTNFLSNAAKFSNKGAKVDIAVHVDHNQAVVTVTDYGKGIPKEFHAKIFQKFSQADGSSTRRYSGTGLGLNICKSLTEKMGGEIGFTSKIGQGSCFYVKFPLN